MTDHIRAHACVDRSGGRIARKACTAGQIRLGQEMLIPLCDSPIHIVGWNDLRGAGWMIFFNGVWMNDDIFLFNYLLQCSNKVDHKRLN